MTADITGKENAAAVFMARIIKSIRIPFNSLFLK